MLKFLFKTLKYYLKDHREDDTGLSNPLWKSNPKMYVFLLKLGIKKELLKHKIYKIKKQIGL